MPKRKRNSGDRLKVQTKDATPSSKHSRIASSDNEEDDAHQDDGDHGHETAAHDHEKKRKQRDPPTERSKKKKNNNNKPRTKKQGTQAGPRKTRTKARRGRINTTDAEDRDSEEHEAAVSPAADGRTPRPAERKEEEEEEEEVVGAAENAESWREKEKGKSKGKGKGKEKGKGKGKGKDKDTPSRDESDEVDDLLEFLVDPRRRNAGPAEADAENPQHEPQTVAPSRELAGRRRSQRRSKPPISGDLQQDINQLLSPPKKKRNTNRAINKDATAQQLSRLAFTINSVAPSGTCTAVIQIGNTLVVSQNASNNETRGKVAELIKTLQSHQAAIPQDQGSASKPTASPEVPPEWTSAHDAVAHHRWVEIDRKKGYAGLKSQAIRDATRRLEKAAIHVQGAKIERIEVIGIDGRAVHAEMRVLDGLHRYLENNQRSGASPSITIGISKLCCRLCHLGIELFRELHENVTVTVQGTHGKLYEKWPLPVFVEHNLDRFANLRVSLSEVEGAARGTTKYHDHFTADPTSNSGPNWSPELKAAVASKIVTAGSDPSHKERTRSKKKTAEDEVDDDENVSSAKQTRPSTPRKAGVPRKKAARSRKTSAKQASLGAAVKPSQKKPVKKPPRGEAVAKASAAPSAPVKTSTEYWSDEEEAPRPASEPSAPVSQAATGGEVPPAKQHRAPAKPRVRNPRLEAFELTSD